MSLELAREERRLHFCSGCCSEVCASRCCFGKKIKFKGEMPRCQSRLNRGSFPEILGRHHHGYSHSQQTESWTNRYKNNCLVFPKHSPWQHEIHTGNVQGLSSQQSRQGVYTGYRLSLLRRKNCAGDEHVSCSRHRFCVKELAEQILSQAHAKAEIWEDLIFPGDRVGLTKEDFPGPSAGLAGRLRLCLALFMCREITHWP